MDTSGKSLLSKWSPGGTGMKSSIESTKSSVLINKSSLLSSGLESKMTKSGGGLSMDRKRKQLTTKASVQDKKLLVGKTPLKSSLTGSPSLLTRGSLKSSLLGTTSLNSNLTSLQRPLTPETKSSVGLSHVTSQTRPLSGGLMGFTSPSISLTSKYTSSGLSTGLGKSLIGQTESSATKNMYSMSQSSVLTSQQPVESLSITKSQTLSSIGMSSVLGSLSNKGKKSQPEEKKGSHKRAAEEKSEFEKYKVKAPRYDLGQVLPKDDGVEVPKFVNPSKDPSLNRPAIPLHDVNGLKLALINAVSGSLICQPNFSNSNDLTRRTLSQMSDRVVTYDPEFILKVALYTRKDLNIRTTANFLLALASNIDACRPFLKKYYCASIQLPSDWIEVAEIYQAFHDTNLTHGSLPAALRKVMIMKFQDFDKYQLAKYNKESSMKKKKKKEKKETPEADSGTVQRGAGRGGRGAFRGRGGRGAVRGRGGRTTYLESSQEDSSSDDSSSDEDGDLHRQLSDIVHDEEEHTPEEMEKIKFSIKQLIRKLHIVEPVEHVMSIIGKKYPDTLEAFYKARLPGVWDQDRAGKRMKLPIPETWETQVSLKGNKASTWEDLIDHKKLPFMAMLRNLRNLIKAGISPKHHQSILRRLQDERQVANSKQFPFRFFTAYEVLSSLEKEYEETQKKLVEMAEMEASGEGMSVHASRGGRGRGRGRGRGKGRGKGDKWWMDKRNKEMEEKRKPKYVDIFNDLDYRHQDEPMFSMDVHAGTQIVSGLSI